MLWKRTRLRRELRRLEELDVIVSWRETDDGTGAVFYVTRHADDPGTISWSRGQTQMFIEGIYHVLRDFDIPMEEYAQRMRDAEHST